MVTSVFDGPQSTSQGAAPAPLSGVKSAFGTAATVGGQAIHAVNPLDSGDSPSVGGFFGNVLHGVGSMVSGVTNLIGQGLHDIVQLAHGPSSLEHPENFQLWKTFKGLTGIGPGPSALLEDYKSRYGWSDFSHGDIWGGIKSIAGGLYDNPLAYVGDALIVGGAAGKAGELGLLGEDLGTKVLGGEVGAGVKLKEIQPVWAGESMTGAVDPLKLSTNPVTRFAQKQLFDHAFAYSPEKALAWAEQRNPVTGAMEMQDVGGYNRAMQALKLAEDRGAPIMRPTASKMLENRFTSHALSIMGVAVQDKSTAAAKAASDAITKYVETLDPAEKSIFDAVAQGTVPMEGLPSVKASTKTVIDTELETRLAGPVPEVTPALNDEFIKTLAKHYKTPIDSAKEPRFYLLDPDSKIKPILTPEDRVGVDGTRILINSTDPTLGDAGTILRDVEKMMDGRETLINVQNDFAKSGSYEGYRGFYRNKDTGDISEVSVSNPTLAREQANWGSVSRKIDDLRAQLENPELDPATKAGLMDELDAAEAYNNYAFSYTRGKQMEKLGVPYAQVAQSADAVRAITHQAATSVELEHGLTFRSIWDRAFLPKRATAHAELMTTLEKKLGKIFEDTIASGGKAIDAQDATIAAIDDIFGAGHPATARLLSELKFREQVEQALTRSQVGEVIPFKTGEYMPEVPGMTGGGQELGGQLATGENTLLTDNGWWGPKGQTDTAAAAKYVTNKIRRLTRESIAENGEFPGFSWKEMLADTEADPLARVPQYFPHIKASSFTAKNVWFKKASDLESEIGRMKKNQAELFDSGMYQKDPIQAYSRLYQEVAKHNEYRNLLMTMVKKYGREPTTEELQAVSMKALPTGEVYITRGQIDALIGGRKNFMTLKHDGMMAGLSPEEATMQALGDMSDAALSSAAERLATGKAAADEIWALPNHVAKLMDRAGKNYLALPPKASFFMKTAMTGWKTSVLGLSPRWVVNNTLGNLVYMGVKDPMAIRRYIEMLMPSRRAYAEAMFGDSVVAGVRQGFMHGEAGDLGSVAEQAQQAGMSNLSGKLDSISQSRARWLIKPSNWTSRKMYMINGWNEQAARMGMAISTAEKQAMLGWMERLDSSYGAMKNIVEHGDIHEIGINAITNQVNAVLGDYMRMSPAEKMVKQYLMPFYPFYRHTAMFIARLPFENPLKFKILQNIDELDREMRPGLPEYMRGAYEISPGFWARVGNANPLQAVTQAYAPNLTNPLLALAVQRLSGTNAFGQPAYDPTGRQMVETRGGIQYDIKYNPDGSFAGVAPITGQWEPPLATAVLGMIPQFGLLTGITPFKYKTPAARLAGFAGVSLSTGKTSQQYAYETQKNQMEALLAGQRSSAGL